MIRIFFLSILLLLPTFAVKAQINSYTITKTEQLLPYDSLENIPQIDQIKRLTGQTIYFPEDRHIENMGGYSKTFYTTPTFQSSILLQEKEVYCPNDNYKTKTRYDAIANRYFKICYIDEKKSYLDYCFTLEEVDQNGNPVGEKKTLYLVDKEVYPRIYMSYLAAGSYDKPHFITIGYWEKLKNNFLNKEFVWSGRNYIVNLSNGREECPPSGTVFKCIEIGLINGHLEAIMENPQLGKFVGKLNQIPNTIFCFVENKTYNRWIKLYGKNTAFRMLEGDIYVGMTKKWFLLHWGNHTRLIL